jgi:hypothetical protein
MPNTLVYQSVVRARFAWIKKRLTHSGGVDFLAAGKGQRRRYFVAWA